ncbi:hypothetical protein M5E06_29555 [Azospirillum sp. A1-3]|uniref:hypothetical protein n=1 Tax=Azospirillum sp. A1-3 TaxID=185874 RepID=UPI00207700B6|nr:hypothetical protein [Azospirillum sp. A1-3]MCM8738277.1 hypothetical protein [Azospirillum sp. A1-3]
MSASNNAIFPQLSFGVSAVVTGANTTLSDTPDANAVELVLPATVETDGAQLVALWALPRATCSATVLYLYRSLDGGTTKRLIATAAVAADTVSTTDAPAEVVFKLKGASISESNPLYLPPGSGVGKTRLYVGASVALAAGWAISGDGLLMQKAA